MLQTKRPTPAWTMHGAPPVSGLQQNLLTPSQKAAMDMLQASLLHLIHTPLLSISRQPHLKIAHPSLSEVSVGHLPSSELIIRSRPRASRRHDTDLVHGRCRSGHSRPSARGPSGARWSSQVSSSRGPDLCIYILTYGAGNSGPPSLSVPIIQRVDCSHLRAPAARLCDRLTGLDDELADTFFSYPENEVFFWRQLQKLEDTVVSDPRAPRNGMCVAVLVNCAAGMHRSVATAERLAAEVEEWGRFDVDVEHLDLEEGMRRQARRGMR